MVATSLVHCKEGRRMLVVDQSALQTFNCFDVKHVVPTHQLASWDCTIDGRVWSLI